MAEDREELRIPNMGDLFSHPPTQRMRRKIAKMNRVEISDQSRYLVCSAAKGKLPITYGLAI